MLQIFSYSNSVIAPSSAPHNFSIPTSSGYGVKHVAANNHFMVSSSTGFISGKGQDAVIHKINLNGNSDWIASFGDTGNDIATGVAIDSLANIIVTGVVTNVGVTPSQYDSFVIKMTSAGSILWQKRFRNDIAGKSLTFYSVCIGANDSIIIAGTNVGADNYNSPICVSLQSNGNLMWSRRINSTAERNTIFYGVTTNPAKTEIYAVGAINGTGGFAQALITRWGVDGSLLTQKTLVETSTGVGRFVEVTADSTGVYAMGKMPAAAGGIRTILSKFDFSLSGLWHRKTSLNSSQTVNMGGALNFDTDGNLMVLSESTVSNQSSKISKFAPSGSLIFAREFLDSVVSSGVNNITSSKMIISQSDKIIIGVGTSRTGGGGIYVFPDTSLPSGNLTSEITLTDNPSSWETSGTSMGSLIQTTVSPAFTISNATFTLSLNNIAVTKTLLTN